MSASGPACASVTRLLGSEPRPVAALDGTDDWVRLQAKQRQAYHCDACGNRCGNDGPTMILWVMDSANKPSADPGLPR